MKLFSKRLLALLMTVLMVIELMPVNVLAEGNDAPESTGTSSVSTDNAGGSGKSAEPKKEQSDSGSSEGAKPESSAPADSGKKEESSGKSDEGSSGSGDSAAPSEKPAEPAAPAQEPGGSSDGGSSDSTPAEGTSGDSQGSADAGSGNGGSGSDAADDAAEDGKKEEDEADKNVKYRKFKKFSQSGNYTKVTVTGKYVKGQKTPSVKRVKVGGAVEAWTVKNVGDSKLSMTAKVKSAPKLKDGETLAFYRVNGSSLGSLIKGDVKVGSSVSVTLSKGMTGVALVKVAAPAKDEGDAADPTDPENPTVDPENPVVDPENPVVDPENPVVDPENPVVDPENPVVDPENPVVDPENPVVDPENPEQTSVTVTISGAVVETSFDGSKQTAEGFTTDVGDKAITVELKDGKTASVSGTDAGEYLMGLTANDFNVTSSEYTDIQIVVNDGKLIIARAAVTVTADDKEKAPGEDDPELTATVKGLFGDDSVSYTFTREEGKEIGEYAITPVGDEVQGNYDVTFVPGKLTIANPVVLVEKTLSEGGVSISGLLPENAVLSVKDGSHEIGGMPVIVAKDISIYASPEDKEAGKKYDNKSELSVTMSGSFDGIVVDIYHEGSLYKTGVRSSEGSVTFTATSFSEYAAIENVPVRGTGITVTFIVDGNTYATAEVGAGETIGAQMPQNPSKEGYRFDKWVDGNGNTVTAETPITEALTATAVFVKTWTVTFYYRGGESPQGDPVTVDDGGTVSNLPTPEAREDYNAFWTVGEQGGQGSAYVPTETRFTTSYAVTQDLHIVPDYTPINYTITFYQDEAKTTVMTTRTVNVSTSYCLNDIPDVPVKSGYSGKWVYASGDFSNTVAATSDMDVWPSYEQSKFTVQFKLDEDTVYQTDTYNKNDELELPSDPVVEGKQFEGWYVGSTQIVGGEPVTSDMTITASFTDKFFVKFVVLNDDGTVKEQLSQYFRNEGEAIGTMPQNPFVAGKVFEKWVDQDTGDVVTAETLVNGNMTVVAIFRTIEVYTITTNYFYKNDQGQYFVFNTDMIQVEGHELPYTIRPAATTQTDGDQVAGAPIYYVSTPEVKVEEGDFDSDKKCTVDIEYVKYTAEYDFVYLLKDLDGSGYTEIERKHIYGVLNSYVTPTVKNYEYAVLESAEGKIIEHAAGDELPVYYTRKNFQLTYDTNGGSYVAGTTMPYETEVALPSTDPTRTGYTFAGWYSDAALTQEVTGSVTVTEDTTLFAKWTGDTVNYTIVYMFEKYNDTGTQSSFEYDNSEEAQGTVGETVHGNDSGIPDKTRAGWEKDEARNAASSVVIAADGSSVLQVYYKLSTYTFYFRPGNYYGYADVTATLKGDTKSGNNNFTYTMTVKLGQDISTTWPTTVTNASFQYGWYTYNPTFGGWTHPNNTVYVTKRLLVTSDMLPTSGDSITYTAAWLLDSENYTVNYWLQNADNDGYTKSTQYSQVISSNPGGMNLGAKDIAGYTYNPSKDDHKWRGQGQNRYIYEYNFYYDRDTYNIDYYYGSTHLDTISNIKFDANINKSPYVWTPTAAQCGVDSDYTFGGWFIDSGLSGDPYVFSTMPAHNMSLYAKWTAPTFTVSFVDEDGSTPLADSQTVEKYKKASNPGTPTKTGYVFDGWYTTVDGSDLFDWNTQITSDTTVYAHWMRKTLTYTVHYVNEQNETVAPDKVVSDPNLTVGAEIMEFAISVAGYRPVNSSGSVVLSADDTLNVITIVYSAKTDETSYTVKYILDPSEYSGNIPVAAETTVEHVPGDTSQVIESAKDVDYATLYAAHPELDGIEFYPDAAEKTLVLTSNAEQNVFYFYYSSYKNAKVTVNYVDMNGDPIATATSQIMKVGKTFTLSRTPVSGWELNKAVEGIRYSGTEAGGDYKITEAVTENGLEFTLFYQRKVTITANSFIKMYDGEALKLPEELADQVTVEGIESSRLTGISFDYSNTDITTNDGRLNAGVATVMPKNAVITDPAQAGTYGPYYKIRYISGTLEVTKINVTVRIEPDRWTGAPYTGDYYLTGFTNPSKTTWDRYILISHDGYKTAYLDTIANMIKSLPNVHEGGAAGSLQYYAESQKDVGDYTYYIELTAADMPTASGNYSVSLYVRPGRLEILPAEITVTTGSDSKTYDGTPLTKDEASITGLIAADEGKVTVTATGTITDPGETANIYSIDWGTVNPDNYKIKEELGTLTVTEGTLKVTVKDIEKVYNGNDQEGRPFVATVTGTGSTIETDDYKVEGLGKDDVLTITYTPAKGKNVGTYTGSFDEISFTIMRDGEEVSGFYEEITFTPGELEITPATLTITAINQTYEFNGDIQGEGDTTYDDPALIAQKVTVDGLKGDDALTSIVLDGQGQDAGEYTINVSGALVNGSSPDTNYDVVYVPGTLTITPTGEYTITVRGNSATREYNGGVRSVSGYTMSTYDSSITITKQLAQNAAKATAKGVAVGTYTMTMTAADFEATSDNYTSIKFIVIPGTLRITPVPDDEEIVDPEVPLAAPASGLGSQVGECFE